MAPSPRLLALVVLGAALLLALRTAEAPPRLQRQASVLVGLALIGSIGSLVAGRGTPEFTAALTLVLVGLTPLVLASRLVRTPEVNAQSLIGGSVRVPADGSVFRPDLQRHRSISRASSSLRRPVSRVCPTTFISATSPSPRSGFGDLVPTTTFGRMLAVTEALTGQFYLVTVVALLVGNYRARRSGTTERNSIRRHRGHNPDTILISAALARHGLTPR